MERDFSKAVNYLTAAGAQQGGYGRVSGRMRDVRASALFLLGEAAGPPPPPPRAGPLPLVLPLLRGAMDMCRHPAVLGQ